MRYFFISAVISTCLLDVWSQNPQNDSPNLPLHRSRRQKEIEEKSEPPAKQTSAGKEMRAPIVHFTSVAGNPGQRLQQPSFGFRPTQTHPIHGAAFDPNKQKTPVKIRLLPTHQSSSPTAYALPSGSEVIVGVIRTTFSCDQRIYGYYADLDNNCQVFHVCVPNQNLETGLDEMIQYSFFCGNQTVFDQAALVCNYVDDALPCSEAPRMYDEVNSRFGITDRPIR